MTHSLIGILSLLGLTLIGGCTGDPACDTCNESSGTDQDQTCDDCTGDDTSIPTAMAKLIVNSTFNAGTEAGDVVEPCEVVIDDKFAGNTGEEIEIVPDVAIEVEVGILDGPHTTDDIPLHTLGPSWDETVWAGASVVTPKVPVTGDLDTPQTVNAGFNLWRPDEYWTCDEVSSWVDGTREGTPAITAYREGNIFTMPGIGAMTVDGINLSMDDVVNGEFTSPITAIVVNVQDEAGEYYITYTCYKSDSNGNQVDADGNPVE